jgi:Set1/Ash2 histone methyltransferase complex subunit ASH2
MRRHANFQAPVGYDKFGYCFSDKQYIFHKQEGKKYGETYKQNDIIGCLIMLPKFEGEVKNILEKEELFKENNKSCRIIHKTLIDNILKGSKIYFFKNGKNLEVAYENILYGKYYPACSLYYGGKVSLIFNPNEMKHRPKVKDLKYFGNYLIKCD